MEDKLKAGLGKGLQVQLAAEHQEKKLVVQSTYCVLGSVCVIPTKVTLYAWPGTDQFRPTL